MTYRSWQRWTDPQAYWADRADKMTDQELVDEIGCTGPGEGGKGMALTIEAATRFVFRHKYGEVPLEINQGD